MPPDILESQCQALVNTVNCVGVMGKGLAKQFKTKYPDMFRFYAYDCQVGKVEVGHIWAYRIANGPWIFNFPTKDHWRNPSQIEWIEEGLKDLVDKIKLTRVDSIAVPPLGCGNGGLDWADVEPLIRKHLGGLGIRVEVYPPDGKAYLLPQGGNDAT